MQRLPALHARLLSAARLSSASRSRVFSSGAAGGGGKPAGPEPGPRRWLPPFFDRLIPEDDPALREYKARERRVVMTQLQRGKLTDALRAGSGRDKLFAAPPFPFSAATPPAAPAPSDAVGSTAAIFPDSPLAAVAGGAEASPAAIFAASAAAGARATVVTVAFQAMGQGELLPWHAALRASPFGLHAPAWPGAPAPAPAPAPPAPPVRLLNIVFLQGWFFRAVRPLMLSSTRRALAADVAACSALSVQPSLQATDHFCDALALHNRVMAHVYVVDALGRVRWRAHGPPARGEADALVATLQALVSTPARR